MRAFWEVLVAAGADVVLSGHDHNYERFLPMDANGRLDREHGIVQFVAGTGGIGTSPFNGVRDNSVVRDAGTLGVLKLTLRPGGYDWEFMPVGASSFKDAGSGTCHGAP